MGNCQYKVPKEDGKEIKSGLPELKNLVSNSIVDSEDKEAMKVEFIKGFKSSLSDIGETCSTNVFNENIPESFKKYSEQNPYVEKYDGDETRILEEEPVKFKNGNYYWGSWNIKGEMEGPGKLIIVQDELGIEGFWKEGKLYKGRIHYPEGIYEGEIEDSSFEGHGKFLYNDGRIYEGDFSKGIKEGYGLFTWVDGSKYWGEFKDDQIDGRGEFIWSNGYYYKGETRKGIFHGEGLLKGPNGSSYKGTFSNGLFHGEGQFTWSAKKGELQEKYVGNYQYGKRQGKGVYYFKNGNIFDGDWFETCAHGFGKYETENYTYESTWRNRQMVEDCVAKAKDGCEDKPKDDSSLFFIIKTKEEDIDIKKIPYINSDVIFSSVVSNAGVVLKPKNGELDNFIK